MKSEGLESAEELSDKKKKKLLGKTERFEINKSNSKKLFYAEENEVLERDVKDDTVIHKEVIHELISVMNKIQLIKSSSDDLTEEEKKDKIESLKVDGIMQFISLRKLNRIGHFRCKRVREATQDAKQNIDEYHLKLQNLIYEVMHLQKEISKCLQFKSKDEDISLISEEEFFNSLEPELAEKLRREGDRHKLVLSRLDWELKKRLELSSKLTECQARKEIILKEIESKKQYLKGLQPKLKAVLESTKPVEQDMDLRFSETLSQQKIANNLPPPLYFLFVQASSFSQACDKDVTVTIIGDVELAQSFDSTTVLFDDDSDNSEDEISEKKTKKHRRITNDTKQVKKQQQLLKKHPLSVVVEIVCLDIGRIKLTFAYYVVLHIVTVSAEIELHGKRSNTEDNKMDVDDSRTASSHNIFDPLSFLQCLYDIDDDGIESPNPNNLFLLNKYGIMNLSDHLGDNERSYRWVQRLCGLHMVTTAIVPQSMESAAVNNSNGASSCDHHGSGGVDDDSGYGNDGALIGNLRRTSYMENMVKVMKRRMRQRWHLFQQLYKLEMINGTSSKKLFDEMLQKCKQKIMCQLVSWGAISYQEYVNLKQNQHIVKCDLASDRDFFFSGVVERHVDIGVAVQPAATAAAPGQHKVTLKFCVLISSDYPVTPPLFSFLIEWKDFKRMAVNDEAVREMEQVVNMKMCSSDDVLISQIVGMCSCFDVYLETGGIVECQLLKDGDGDGGKQVWRSLVESQKTFLRTTKGITRSKPYKFDSQLGFYSQY